LQGNNGLGFVIVIMYFRYYHDELQI